MGPGPRSHGPGLSFCLGSASSNPQGVSQRETTLSNPRGVGQRETTLSNPPWCLRRCAGRDP